MPTNLTFYFLLNINCGKFFFIIFLKVLGMFNLFMLIVIAVGFLWLLISALKSNLIDFISVSFNINGKNRLIIALKLLIFFF